MKHTNIYIISTVKRSPIFVIVKCIFVVIKASLAHRHPYNLGSNNRRYDIVPTHKALISQTYPPPTFSSQKLSNPWLKFSPPPAPLTPQQLAATTIGPLV